MNIIGLPILMREIFNPVLYLSCFLFMPLVGSAFLSFVNSRQASLPLFPI